MRHFKLRQPLEDRRIEEFRMRHTVNGLVMTCEFRASSSVILAFLTLFRTENLCALCVCVIVIFGGLRVILFCISDLTEKTTPPSRSLPQNKFEKSWGLRCSHFSDAITTTTSPPLSMAKNRKIKEIWNFLRHETAVMMVFSFLVSFLHHQK